MNIVELRKAILKLRDSTVHDDSPAAYYIYTDLFDMLSPRYHGLSPDGDATEWFTRTLDEMVNAIHLAAKATGSPVFTPTVTP